MRQQNLVELLFRICLQRFHLGANLAELGPTLFIAEVAHLPEDISHLIAHLSPHPIGDISNLVLLFVDELEFLLNFIAGDESHHSAAPEGPTRATRTSEATG